MENEIREYFDTKEEHYNIVFSFIDGSDSIDNDFHVFKSNIEEYEITTNSEEFEHFLRLILSISNNHHRHTGFSQRIEKVLFYFEKEIKQTFSNFEIFNIFQSSKQILLFLISKNILTLDKSIVDLIMKDMKLDNKKYCHFFLPEIKEFIEEEKIKEIENDLLKSDSNIFNNFERKRQEGENDSEICSLIRKNSVEEFIVYVTKNILALSSIIKPSIFETNSFLLGKETTFIEYAAFFGSIQIFKYLKFSEVELKPSLWIFTIHSNNAEMIHTLEENQVEAPNDSFEICLKESIKCHHNDIANYIKINLLPQKSDDLNEFLECAFHYSNYQFFPKDYDQEFMFFYLCKYRYFTVVDIILCYKLCDIEAEIILIYIIFFMKLKTIYFFNNISKHQTFNLISKINVFLNDVNYNFFK